MPATQRKKSRHSAKQSKPSARSKAVTARQLELLCRFNYSHIEFDGKLQNTIDALTHLKARYACLGLMNPRLDPLILDQAELAARCKRIRKVIARLKRDEDIRAHLVIPGLLPPGQWSPQWSRYLRTLLEHTVESHAEVLWFDDPGNDRSPDSRSRSARAQSFQPDDVLKLAGQLGTIICEATRTMRVGLIAADADRYRRVGLDPLAIASTLAGNDLPLMASPQGLATDYHRTAILHTAATLASDHAAETIGPSADQPSCHPVGLIQQPHASNFHKAAETNQLQLVLNILYGRRQLLIDCFDDVGSAPGKEHVHLNAIKQRSRYFKLMARTMARPYQPIGLRVVTTGSDAASHRWARLLGRMGLPVKMTQARQVPQQPSTDPIAGARGFVADPYLVSGKDVAETITKDQFLVLLAEGVLFDAEAATLMASRGWAEQLGIAVEGPLPSAQCEMLSDGGFAQPYYGRSIILDHATDQSAETAAPLQLRLTSDHARAITTLWTGRHTPTMPGIVVHETADSDTRSAVLPYSVRDDHAGWFLNPVRQRHMADLLTWLKRGRLSCQVENTADVVPFCFFDTSGKRLVLVLLNVGYDWAVDTRVRLPLVPFPINSVQEISERGTLEAYDDLTVEQYGSYRYLELNDDTAVPPMQMSVFLLKSR